MTPALLDATDRYTYTVERLASLAAQISQNQETQAVSQQVVAESRQRREGAG